MWDQVPILYSFRRCPYAIRARLALQVSGQQYALREVVLRDKPEPMLTASPKGTVPVLVLPEGQVIDESKDIMLWALERHDPQNWLSPQGGSLPEMLRLIERAESEFKTHLDRYKYENRYQGADALAHRSAASDFLLELEERLAHGDWLFGPGLSVADAALAPFIRQFANTDRAWFDAQPWPALLAWLEDFLASPLFLSVMKKYPKWHEGDEEPIFPESSETRWQRRAQA